MKANVKTEETLVKKFKSFFVAAVVVAAMSLSSASAIAETAPPSSTIVDSSNPVKQPRTSFLTIDNANLNNGGNSWFQPSGYDYARVYVTNTTSSSLTVYVSYDSDKTNIGTHTVSANSSLTINVSHASGHVFYLDYATSSGTAGGKLSVRASDVPLT
ncbi:MULTISPECIES: hypothetical protein [Paenibacillus]|uniref:hypothetical protein n=1 Tax=Paenibacillus TaxID=44249 RepID=UPI0011AFD21E|nr:MULTISPECIES: hypothetical protein [Paenibacillus]QGG58216.1 hypothetical protein GE073_23300 [Paenibacillus sp. B01]